MRETGLDRIMKMLEVAHTSDTVFPPTDLYNEGWMLRLVLSFLFQSKGIDCLPFSFLPGSRWYSEARLSSPFLRRSKSDPLSESHTHPDGTIGHFAFREGTKTGLELTADATQFVVNEAKIFSPLTQGVTHADYYDQAARTVACMAWTIYQAKRSVYDFESLGFYVIAPQEQIEKVPPKKKESRIREKTKKSSIRKKVECRIHEYHNEGKKYEELETWRDDFFLPVLEKMDIQCISWETAIEKTDDSIREFYDRCIEFKKKKDSL